MRRTLAALLALGSASALRVSLPEHGPAGRRRALLTAGAAAAGATLLVGPPRAALADRGKDLYTSDQEVLSGVRGKDFGESQVDVLPEFDADGKLVVRNGVVEDTQYRTVKSGPAAVRMLRNWEQAGDGLNDPVTGSAAELFRIASYDTSLKSIADLGPPERGTPTTRSPAAAAVAASRPPARRPPPARRHAPSTPVGTPATPTDPTDLAPPAHHLPPPSPSRAPALQ